MHPEAELHLGINFHRHLSMEFVIKKQLSYTGHDHHTDHAITETTIVDLGPEVAHEAVLIAQMLREEDVAVQAHQEHAEVAAEITQRIAMILQVNGLKKKGKRMLFLQRLVNYSV